MDLLETKCGFGPACAERFPLHLADTSFMYMIAGLCMLKLYQKRHPDINASAYTAYACLAAVIFFSVIGVVRTRKDPHTDLHAHAKRSSLPVQVFGRGNTVFWIVFSVIHILATLLLSTQLYYMGRWRLGETPAGTKRMHASQSTRVAKSLIKDRKISTLF